MYIKIETEMYYLFYIQIITDNKDNKLHSEI